MRADSNATACAHAIALSRAGSHKPRIFSLFLWIYGRARLPKIFYLK
jgi:hypothetical protein